MNVVYTTREGKMHFIKEPGVYLLLYPRKCCNAMIFGVGVGMTEENLSKLRITNWPYYIAFADHIDWYKVGHNIHVLVAKDYSEEDRIEMGLSDRCPLGKELKRFIKGHIVSAEAMDEDLQEMANSILDRGDTLPFVTVKNFIQQYHAVYGPNGLPDPISYFELAYHNSIDHRLRQIPTARAINEAWTKLKTRGLFCLSEQEIYQKWPITP